MKSLAVIRRVLLPVIVVFVASYPFTLVAQEEQDQVVHVIQAGETLSQLSRQYGVSVQELVAANGIANPSRIERGASLIIPGVYVPVGEEVYNPLIAGTPITHVVAAGETINAISRQYNASVEQILLANNISDPNRINRGQELTIWTAEAAEQETVDAGVDAESGETVDGGDSSQSTGTVAYIVQPGEHLSQIAQRHGLSWTTLAQINQIADPNNIYAGQTLQIPTLDANGQPVLDDMGLLVAPTGPGATITVGKQIVIDLSEQMTYAYENGVLVNSTLVSTGLPATPTVQGDYKIYHRVRSQRMTGPGYDLDNVEWVQYFHQGYGLHGTYWHNNFGRPMSHGCVNMTNEAARWFYEWADYGTPVHVRA